MKTSSLALAIVLLAGCGDQGQQGIANQGDPDGAIGRDAMPDTPAIDASEMDDATDARATWRSWNITVSKVSRTFAKPVPAAEAADWNGRVDLRADGVPAVVVTPEYGTPVAMASAGTAWTAKDSPIRIVTSTSFGSVEDRWTAFEVTGTTAPKSTKATGISIVTTGDETVEGTVEAVVTFEPDLDGPLWEPSAKAAFADQALPWDPRAFVASEPYEEFVSLLYVFPMDATTLVLDRRMSSAWGTTKEFGLDVRARDWNTIADLEGVGADMIDLTGNHLDGAPRFKFGGAKVPARADKIWTPAATDAFVWGAATIAACGSGSCLSIGPFAWDACSRGSDGGVAVRFPGAGSATLAVEIVGTSSAAPPPALPFFVVVAEPGKDAVSVTTPTPSWTTRSDGSFSASVVVSAPNTGGSETGVALSAGGVGPKKPASCASAPRYQFIVRLSRIELGG